MTVDDAGCLRSARARMLRGQANHIESFSTPSLGPMVRRIGKAVRLETDWGDETIGRAGALASQP
jgi:hypothetical protein